MEDERCTQGRHIGEDAEGRCSCCGDRIDRPDPLLTLLVIAFVTAATVLAIRVLLIWLPT